MGNPKQKWTPEEEAALRAGVDKHGAGKWRTIQKDPEFAGILATRSNVDLKDKWRNMNVGLVGGSREKTPKSSTKLSTVKGADEAAAGEFSTEENVDTDSSKDRKLLDSRYTDIIVKAISEMNEPNGSSTTAVAAFIEAHHPVPSNFRRMLSSKLKDMVTQGNLCKAKQNYKVSTGALQARDEKEANKNNINLESHSKSQLKGGNIARYDPESAKMKCKSLHEAAQLAALAVAEAEAAAAAAERAAKEAEAAQAEAEAAEIAAELALLAARPSKKVCGSSIRVEDKGIAV